MSSDRAVLNASPMITLCKSGQEDLLPQLFGEIVLPGAVWEEVEAGGANDPAAQRLGVVGWIKRDAAVAVAPIIQAWDLGAGESAGWAAPGGLQRRPPGNNRQQGLDTG